MKIKKKHSRKFFDGVCKGLVKLGAKKVKNTSDGVFLTYELQTIVGKLTINVRVEQTVCFSVFSRFEDVARAKQKFNCNPYTGKYNIHLGIQEICDESVDAVVDAVISHFECTLPKENA